MSQISSISLSLRTETIPPRPQQQSPPKSETDDISGERTQALARQLDEQLSIRLFAIREHVKTSQPPDVGRILDIQA